VAKGYRIALLTTLAFALMLFGATAQAGKVYQLELCYYTDIPTYPAHIEVTYYEGDKCEEDKIKGTSSMDFEWFGTFGENYNFMHDGVAFLTSAWEENGMLRVCFTMTGHDDGKFKSTTSFGISVNGMTSCLEDIHTSCSRVIPVDEPLMGDGPGTFYILGGIGGTDCLPAHPDCPDYDDKLYELYGKHVVPLNGCVPDLITFNNYKSDNDLRGTSTATWTGSGLDNIVCDSNACLVDAYLEGDYLVVCWEAYGQKDSGEFESSSSFEVDLGACGVFKLQKYHTSCSQPVYLNTAFYIRDGDFDPDNNCDCGNGYVVLTGGCGACMIDQPIATEESSWSSFKNLY
jgi:hypothetical protein